MREGTKAESMTCNYRKQTLDRHFLSAIPILDIAKRVLCIVTPYVMGMTAVV